MKNYCLKCNIMVQLQLNENVENEGWDMIDSNGELFSSWRFYLDCPECGEHIRFENPWIEDWSDEASQHAKTEGEHEFYVEDSRIELIQGETSVLVIVELDIECCCGWTHTHRFKENMRIERMPHWEGQSTTKKKLQLAEQTLERLKRASACINSDESHIVQMALVTALDKLENECGSAFSPATSIRTAGQALG